MRDRVCACKKEKVREFMSEEKVWGIHTQDDRLFPEDNVIAIG